MPFMISQRFVTFEIDDFCGTGSIERLIAYLKTHVPPPPSPDNGYPIIEGLKLSSEVHEELLGLTRTLIETSERFEQVLGKK